MDPFPTKGIEYLLMIGYLALFIPFAWMLKWMAREPSPESEEATAPPKPARARPWFELPDGFHLHRGHTWAYPLGDAMFKVGIGHFAERLIGEPRGLLLPSPGETLEQGERGWQFQVNGHTLDLLSPLGGEVVEVNEEAVRSPSLVSEDPYGRGWLMKIRAGREQASLKNLLPERLARAWMDETSERLEALMGEELGPVLQDGGIPVSGFARQLAGDRWPEIAAKLLLTE